jgi:hypothetical protein
MSPDQWIERYRQAWETADADEVGESRGATAGNAGTPGGRDRSRMPGTGPIWGGND